MLVLKWTAEHECRKKIKADGISAKIHMQKGSSFDFPESVEKIVRKQFSDALQCGYCEIERIPDKGTAFKKFEKGPTIKLEDI